MYWRSVLCVKLVCSLIQVPPRWLSDSARAPRIVEFSWNLETFDPASNTLRLGSTYPLALLVPLVSFRALYCIVLWDLVLHKVVIIIISELCLLNDRQLVGFLSETAF